MSKPKAAFVALVISFVLAAAGCGGDDDTGGGGGGGGADGGDGGGGGSGQAVTLTIVDFAFNPPTLTAGAGEEVTVTVTNDGEATPTYTLDPGSVDQEVAAGETVEVSFTFPDESGGFHCEIHPDMTGTLEVA
jgi:plastocyanin